MARWTDGPEFAPVERPAAFVAPSVPTLPDPEPVGPTSEELPIQEPSFVAPSQPAPDLRELVPSAAPGRNPNLPFESLASTMTALQPEVAQRSPDQPFVTSLPVSGHLPVQQVVQPTAQVNPTLFPAPGTPQWFAPPPGVPVIPAPSSVTFAQIWTSTTNWVMVPLLVAMFILPIAPIALLVAWLSTVQIRYRRAAIRKVYTFALLFVGVVSLLAALLDDTITIWEPLTITSLLTAWVLVFVTPGMVGAALRNREPADRH